MSRFAKGTAVKMFFEREMEQQLKDSGISYRKVKYVVNGKLVDAVSFDCFVSGDDDKLGLSIVALDNPEYCAYHFNPKYHRQNKKIDEAIRKTISNNYSDGQLTYNPERSFMASSPSCPY